MNELLSALVQLGIITNATAQRINRDLNPVEAAAWAESVIGDAFTGALAAQEVRLLDLVAATNGRPTAAQINSFWRREDDFLWGSVQSSVETVAQERAIVAALTGVADDKTWNKINDAVLNWVGDYYTNLDVDLVGSIPNLNATGRTEFARSFIDWQRGELETAGAQDGLPQLIRAIEPTFGQARAARIAATETTRIFYEATYHAANANPNVTAFRWYSAADERVCFPEGTQVSTSTGDVSIETIKPGDYVLTRGGYRKVAAASARPYQGAMSTVITRNGAVTATSDHPFWTLEQGWLQCGDLTTSHTLQTFNDQSVNITGVVNFRVGDTANYPTVGFKQFDLAGISLGVLMPVNSIDFEGNTQFGKQEVNGVSPDLRLLNELYVGRFENGANGFLYRRLASKRAIAGKATESPGDRSWLDSEKFPAVIAGDLLRWSAAFFRAVMPIQVLLRTKNISTSLACYIFGGSSPTIPATNGISISNFGTNREILSADWTSFRNHRRGFGDDTAISGTVSSAPVQLKFGQGLSANFAILARQYTDFVIASLRTIKFTLPRRIKFLSTSLAYLFHEMTSGAICSVIESYHMRSSGAILVYDLQVEDDHEFYANGILVHNCPICGPNHLVVVPKSQRTWPNGATIPAHPNCRCRAIEETALTLETPLPREERYRWSAETYANYQAEQAAARRPTNIIDTLTG